MEKKQNYVLPVDKQNLYIAVETAVKAARSIINQGRMAYSKLFATKYNKTPEQVLAAIDITTDLVSDIPDKFRQVLITLDLKETEVESERREKITERERANKAEGKNENLEEILINDTNKLNDLIKEIKDTKENYETIKTQHGLISKEYDEEKNARARAQIELNNTSKLLKEINTRAEQQKVDLQEYNNTIISVLENYFGVPKSEIKTLASNPGALTQKLEEKAKENKEMQDSILEGFDESIENTNKEKADDTTKKPVKKGKTVSVKGLKN